MISFVWTDLANGVDLREVPLGLVLEVNLVPREVGLRLRERDLSLSKSSVQSRPPGS